MRNLATALAILIAGAALSGCRPDTSPTNTPKPMKSAVQPAPSWKASIDLGCLYTRWAVDVECLEQGGPLCENAQADQSCFWIDHADGQVWYRP